MKGGFITASLDVTATELADELVGGVLPAHPKRLEVAGELGLPQVVSLGALDMVNFGPKETVPERFAGRNLYVHNPTITLMRTTPDECRELGRRIGRKLSKAKGPTALFVPLRGVSMIATEGQPFYDPEADEALREGLHETLGPNVEVHELDLDVNDPEFALAMANRLHELIVEESKMTRGEALARLRAQVAEGRPIIGAGAGTGLSAKCAEAGGGDLIIIYNSGRYRMAGRGSLAGLLPYGDANAIVVDMAREVLPIVRETPVLAGVCGTDPFRLMPVFLEELKRIGFSGVQNFPTVGLFDGTFRANLEETGMGFGLEVEMIREARALDLLTCPYVFIGRRGPGHGRGRCGRARAAHGADDEGDDRRLDSQDARRVGRADPGDARRGQGDRPGRARALPRRSDRRARGRRLRARADERRGRLLRRLVDGAAADRGGDDGEHEAVQVDRRLPR